MCVFGYNAIMNVKMIILFVPWSNFVLWYAVCCFLDLILSKTQFRGYTWWITNYTFYVIVKHRWVKISQK